MGFFLLDNPPARSQFRKTRREPERGVIVLHSTESTPDTVGFDGGAEANASFIARRNDPGSYHVIVDSDGPLRLMPDSYEAFQDGTGSNPWAWSISAATRADIWPIVPATWRARCLLHMGVECRRYANELKARRGIEIPARRITRAESERGIPGFITHGLRDPGRRHDPGFGDAEWTYLFDIYNEENPTMATAAEIAALDFVDRTYRTERSINRVRAARRAKEPIPATHERDDAPDFAGLTHHSRALVGAKTIDDAKDAWLGLVAGIRAEGV